MPPQEQMLSIKLPPFWRCAPILVLPGFALWTVEALFVLNDVARVSYETSCDAKQPKLELKLVLTLSESTNQKRTETNQIITEYQSSKLKI
jgi:hypothetical protein